MVLNKNITFAIIVIFLCASPVYCKENKDSSITSLFKYFTNDNSNREKPLILLVHGLAVDLNKTNYAWGEYKINSDGSAHWNGMIGYLNNHNFSFGGIIDANKKHLVLPDSLNKKGATKDSKHAEFFSLSFSPEANDDGIAYKVLELKKALQELKKFTGRNTVIIIAYSAGGLVARAYMQNAIPRATYNDDVSTLITIATPHMGSAYARLFGQFIGVKATSLKPDSPLIETLNTKLELNSESKFASIIVKGLGADIRGKGKVYNKYINPELLRKLPYDFINGGDQVVHSKSQNLMLTPTAQRYEKKTGKPILYFIARVDDPATKLTDLTGEVVHTVAPFSPEVQKLVLSLILNNENFWQKIPTIGLQYKKEMLQVNTLIQGIIEREALKQHSVLSQVDKISIDLSSVTRRDKGVSEYHFKGTAYSYNKFIKLRRRRIEITGDVIFQWDKARRVVSEEYVISNLIEKSF